MKPSSLTLIAAVLSFCFASCLKATTPTAAEGTWYLHGAPYTVKFTERADSLGYAVLIASDSGFASGQILGNNISLWFQSFPTTTGYYDVIPFDSNPLPFTAAGQVAIIGNTMNDTMDHCSDSSLFRSWLYPENDSILITVTKGNISATIPQMTVLYQAPLNNYNCLMQNNVTLQGSVQEAP